MATHHGTDCPCDRGCPILSSALKWRHVAGGRAENESQKQIGAHRALTICLLLICFSACSGEKQSDAVCAWPEASGKALDLQAQTDRQHLAHDAFVAEDLAIRYGDWHRRHPSRTTDELSKHGGARYQCMDALVGQIADAHGVTPKQVRAALLIRPISLDASVFVSFAAFYALAVNFLLRRVVRQFSDDGWPTVAVVMIVLSLLTSLVGLGLGEIWAIAAETIRIGSGHLSNRVGRVPWVQNRDYIFAVGVLLFWAIALLRYRYRYSDSSDAALTPLSIRLR